MPFDPTPLETSIEDPTTLYHQRRESAAALWVTIPRRKFNMDNWKCGSTCCALGWLAELHNDWFWDGSTPCFAVETGFEAAATYFAITMDESHRCFGLNDKDISEFRTAHAVGKFLLSLPYNPWNEVGEP